MASDLSFRGSNSRWPEVWVGICPVCKSLSVDTYDPQGQHCCDEAPIQWTEVIPKEADRG